MEARSKTIEQWFSMIEQGQIVLPRFQRHQAWGHAQIIGLLENVLRKPSLPIGALLILEVGNEEPFLSRPVAGAPTPTSKPSMHLLDGQQRVTALWRGLTGDYSRDNFDIFVSLGPSEQSQEGEDEMPPPDSPTISREKRWDRRGVRQPVWADSPIESFKRDLIPATCLRPGRTGEATLEKWLASVREGGLDPSMRMSRIYELRQRAAGYMIPFLSLPVGTSRETALDVFIKMNTSASPLTDFDIVVAQLEEASGESLHDLVSALLREEPAAKDYGKIEDNILAVAALVAGKPPLKKTYLDKGFGESLGDNWPKVKAGLRRGLAFLRSEGVFNEHILPSEVAVYLTCALWAEVPDQGFDAEGKARTILRKVLWRTCYTDRYGKTSATRAFMDYRALKEVLESPATTTRCDLFDQQVYPIPEVGELISAGWPGRKDRLPRAMLATSLRAGGYDFADGAPVHPQNLDRREYHHLYPVAVLQGNRSDERVNRALNCALISWTTNRKIAANTPREYIEKRAEAASLGEPEVRQRLASHLIPFDALVAGDYDAFLQARAEMMAKHIRMLCEGQIPHELLLMTSTTVPSVSVTYAQTGASTRANEHGMRPMQERAYEKRGEQYLLIKSPPASGKSRALMFIALDKLHNQGRKQAIIVVPEKAIGASFNNEPLTKFGFWADWTVAPKWNLCNAPGEDGGKVNSVGAFLASEDKILVCTHATFRFAVDKFGVEAFDDRLIAVDEFHHVSASPDNKLGTHLGEFIARDKVHIVAMTGSYFRGDAEAVLAPQDEAKFDSVTYTYYEQLNGYEYLKQLDIGYFFYSGSYAEDMLKVLDPAEKTIVHIPSVNSRESTKDKIREVEHIIEELGEWQGTDPATGFQLVKTPDGRMLRIADLVDDDPSKRDRVSTALKDPTQKNNRDHVDIIIALGMAKEGFDWIWCGHALTVGYRSSLTEIVQIIGRATRDAPGKTRARFTNLIAEPDASEEAVTEAVNDTLKAIAASLLMEQVLAPRFNFTPKNPSSGPIEGFDYGENGYDPKRCNVGFNEETGQFQIEIKGLAEPKSKEAARICQEDLNEVIAAFVQDKTAIERGIFDEELVPEELTQVRMGKIIKDKYPELDEDDQEAVRQHAVAALNLTQQAKQVALGNGDTEQSANTALIDGVRRFAMDVRELDIDLIDRINPFGEAYAILAKTMSEASLKQVAAAIAAKRTSLTPEEAKELAVRAVKFKKERGRLPLISSPDAWEKRMAEGAAAFVRFKDEGRYE